MIRKPQKLIKFSQTLPNDFNSEKILLGTLLYSSSMGNKELEKAIGSIENIAASRDFSKHFYTKIHEKIYELIFLSHCCLMAGNSS